ncbi:MAG: hypothetical protein R3324_09180, partial [Halobacteriales archaeon]|nr:hypothetical protein [Halobacteriales archaeon]
YKPEVIRDLQGNEVTSLVTLWVASTKELAATALYTLSSGETPPLQRIEQHYDDDGLHHNVLYFG